MMQWKHAIRQIEGEARQVELRRLFNQIIAGGGSKRRRSGSSGPSKRPKNAKRSSIQAEAKRWLDETKNNVTQALQRWESEHYTRHDKFKALLKEAALRSNTKPTRSGPSIPKCTVCAKNLRQGVRHIACPNEHSTCVDCLCKRFFVTDMDLDWVDPDGGETQTLSIDMGLHRSSCPLCREPVDGLRNVCHERRVSASSFRMVEKYLNLLYKNLHGSEVASMLRRYLDEQKGACLQQSDIIDVYFLGKPKALYAIKPFGFLVKKESEEPILNKDGLSFKEFYDIKILKYEYGYEKGDNGIRRLQKPLPSSKRRSSRQPWKRFSDKIGNPSIQSQSYFDNEDYSKWTQMLSEETLEYFMSNREKIWKDGKIDRAYDGPVLLNEGDVYCPNDGVRWILIEDGWTARCLYWYTQRCLRKNRVPNRKSFGRNLRLAEYKCLPAASSHEFKTITYNHFLPET